jgi:multiple antibiotic resistance protein
MHQFPAGSLLTDLLISYMTLLSIINPFGLAFVFYARTRALPEPARIAVARRIGLYSLIILAVSLFIGSYILRFFGITVPALRIAGGLVVALSGWSMLTAPDEPDTISSAQGDASQIEGMVFVPLTVPLTTGPGSIAAAIALGADRTGGLRETLERTAVSLTVAILVAATITLAYSRASSFSRWAGREGTRVITRMSAFLLMCVGVQIVLIGIADVLPEIISEGVRIGTQ